MAEALPTRHIHGCAAPINTDQARALWLSAFRLLDDIRCNHPLYKGLVAFRTDLKQAFPAEFNGEDPDPIPI